MSPYSPFLFVSVADSKDVVDTACKESVYVDSICSQTEGRAVWSRVQGEKWHRVTPFFTAAGIPFNFVIRSSRLFCQTKLGCCNKMWLEESGRGKTENQNDLTGMVSVIKRFFWGEAEKKRVWADGGVSSVPYFSQRSGRKVRDTDKPAWLGAPDTTNDENVAPRCNTAELCYEVAMKQKECLLTAVLRVFRRSAPFSDR